jgi:hypothetical protein
MKKYCNDCEYYRYFSGYTPRPSNVCLFLSKGHLNPIKEFIIDEVGDCLKINKNLNCKYYKKIWWKFWLKKE